MTQHGPVVLADVVRNGFVEGTEVGHAVLVAPDGQVERELWIRQGKAPRSIAMNCSGEHTAMLATRGANRPHPGR